MDKRVPKIVYEDDSIIVFNKPHGMVVNVSNTSSGGTLQEYVAEVYKDTFKNCDTSATFCQRNGLVHRLDKDTSGLIVVAKDSKSFDTLQRQFKSREVTKEYIALVFGEVLDDSIEVNVPIGRNPRNRFKMAVVEDGRSSVTYVEKIRHVELFNQALTLVRVYPKTGRTHQIRVHLVAINHPIVGDDIYSGQKRGRKYREEIGRLMLHAYKITIFHPSSGEEMTFTAPVPEEFCY